VRPFIAAVICVYRRSSAVASGIAQAGLLGTLAAGPAVAATTAPAVSEAVRDRIRTCAACHGEGGNSRIAGVPSLAGQPKLFLETQLVLFREGVRPAPQMQPAVKGLTDRDISQIATVFSASAPAPQAARADPALAGRGRGLARKLRCESCHLADYGGREQIPRLAGQREEYLAEAMLAFRDNRRPGGDTIMAGVLYGVPDADVRAMAHYLAHLP
jgi:cytochrome c553